MTKKFTQPTGYMPGIYLNMPDEEYHADKALSHSGITDILSSEMDYWENSPLNPSRRFKESDAMAFGKRCHMMLLEPDKFFETFNVAGSGWRKDRITITSNEFALIKESTKILTDDKDTAAYFKLGYPEVSIFWVDPVTKIRLRIRVDYLRTFGSIDLKRLRSIQTKKIGYDIVQYGYDIQDHLYRQGIEAARKGLRDGSMKVHGGTIDPAWLNAFMNEKDNMFIFFIQRSTRPFIYRIWYFDDHIRKEAETLCNKGIMRYKNAIEKYGESGWPYGNPKAEKFTIDNLPRRNFDE